MAAGYTRVLVTLQDAKMDATSLTGGLQQFGEDPGFHFACHMLGFVLIQCTLHSKELRAESKGLWHSELVPQ